MVDSVTQGILNSFELPEQFIEVYNRIPGVRPVTRMGDRSTAHTRLVLALERADLKLARPYVGQSQIRLVPADRVNSKNSPEKRIRVLVPNPKRPGTASWHRFELYRDGMTIGEYMERAMATGISRVKARQDLCHDRSHGFISCD